MKIVTFFIFIVIFFSCSVNLKITENSVVGIYEFIDNNNRRIIELKSNTKFSYSYVDHNGNINTCNGTWELYNKNKIDLSCFEPIEGECKLLSGYTGLNNWEVSVQSINTIVIGTYKFRRNRN